MVDILFLFRVWLEASVNARATSAFQCNLLIPCVTPSNLAWISLAFPNPMAHSPPLLKRGAICYKLCT